MFFKDQEPNRKMGKKHYELNFIEASIRTAYKQKRTC